MSKWYLILISLIIISSFSSISSSTNAIGLDGSYSAVKIFSFGGFIEIKNISAHLAYGNQPSDGRGKLVSEQLWNYGRTVAGHGSNFSVLDAGLGYHLYNIIRICGEISHKYEDYYTNYIDNRFNGGGYHMIDSSKTTRGFGWNVALTYVKYLESSGGYSLELFVGHNTVKKSIFGIRLAYVAKKRSW